MIILYIVEFLRDSFVEFISGSISIALIFGTVKVAANAILQYWSHDKSEIVREKTLLEESCAGCGRPLTLFLKIYSKKCSKCHLLECFQCIYDETCSACSPKGSKDELPESFGILKLELIENTKVATLSAGVKYGRDEEVRRFMNSLVESAICVDLSDVPFIPLYTVPEYDLLYFEYHHKISEVLTSLASSLHATIDDAIASECGKPSTIYMQLKQTAHRLEEDASQLPILPDIDTDCLMFPDNREMACHSYEDILAIAIINKVLERCQKSKKVMSSKKYDVKIDNNDIKPSVIDNTSIMVEEEIEEITKVEMTDNNEGPIVPHQVCVTLNPLMNGRASFPELGKDIVDASDPFACLDEENNVTEVINLVDSWEDNWLFRRKKIFRPKNTHHPVPVPMLVPNPETDCKVLIGDVEAEDTSDLSECSDSVLEDLIYCSPSASDSNKIPDFTCEPIIISSRKNFEVGSSRSLYDTDQYSSGVASISRDTSDILSITSHSNSEEDNSYPWIQISDTKLREMSQFDSGEGSLDGTQDSDNLKYQEESFSEFTSSCTIEERNNHIESPVENMISVQDYLENGSTKNDISQENICSNNDRGNMSSNNNHENICSNNDQENICSNNDREVKSSRDSDDLFSVPPKSGTLAEREHLKWELAAPIPNNPYSTENIAKRNMDNLLPRSSLANFEKDSSVENTISVSHYLPNHDVSKYERDYYVKNKNLQSSEHNEKVETDGKDLSCRDVNSSDSNSLIDDENKKYNFVNERSKKSNLVRVSSWSDRQKPAVLRKQKEASQSVKELAKKFSMTINEDGNQSPVIGNQLLYQKTPVGIKNNNLQNMQVHSLTARSICREFREGLKKNNGSPQAFNRNVRLDDSQPIFTTLDSKSDQSEQTF